MPGSLVPAQHRWLILPAHRHGGLRPTLTYCPRVRQLSFVLGEFAVWNGPLVRFIRQEWSPPCWQRQQSIAQFLVSVLDCVPRYSLRLEQLRDAVAAGTEELAAAAVASRRPRPQRAFAQALTRLVFPDDLPSLLLRRLRAWLPEVPLPPLGDMAHRWALLRGVLPRSKPSSAWAH